VVDLAQRFGVASNPVTKRTCIVIVEVELGGEHAVMGILADSVSEVLALGANEIEPPPAFGTRVKVDLLAGMGKIGKKFVLLLDIDRVLGGLDLDAVADAPGEASKEART
jgi:purine-binding chemotaxis protein CheW